MGPREGTAPEEEPGGPAPGEPDEQRAPPARDSLRLLVTNDDGIHARGLELLATAARTLGEVDVVAPDRQQSASSHSLTLHRPLRITQIDKLTWAVDGTPTDCVLLAVNRLLEQRPDFVLSGVNHGPNMGEDVLYSGTVAAAMEATILGIPAVALSFVGNSPERLKSLEPSLARLLRGLLDRDDFPAETFFNVNVPDVRGDELQGVRVTALGRRVYSDSLTQSRDPQGREYFWIGGGQSHWRGREDSDFRAVEAGYISVTPLHLDLTNFRLIEEVRSWRLTVG